MSTNSNRRYLSLWLRRLPTDRAQKALRIALDRPFAIVGPEKNARILTAVNDAAARLNLRAGQRFADACAIFPMLAFAESAAKDDARLLENIADACERYTPLVGTHPPDGVILDITGAAHLFGGEASLARDLLRRLTRQGFAAKISVADTVGAAWALARYGKPAILASGETRAALLPLPLPALRLEPEILAGLSEMGLRCIGDIAGRPRAPLAARFGALLLQRLDCALGYQEEPITPRTPLAPYSVEQGFSEPLSRDEDLLAVLQNLLERLSALLEKRGQGARQLTAQFFAVDGTVRRIAIGASRASRDVPKLHRLFSEKFAGLSWPDEFGYDRVRLSAPVSESLIPAQKHLTAREEGTDLAHLIDRLGVRLGESRVQRLIMQDSHVPEFACVPVPAASAAEFSPSCIQQDTLALARPLRLFERAESIEQPISAVPDGPPIRFRWRRVWHDVASAEGPERIALPWWRDGEGRALTRDYFRVEAQDGARFWLYRDGLYGYETDRPRWYLHGLLP